MYLHVRSNGKRCLTTILLIRPICFVLLRDNIFINHDLHHLVLLLKCPYLKCQLKNRILFCLFKIKKIIFKLYFYNCRKSWVVIWNSSFIYKFISFQITGYCLNFTFSFYLAISWNTLSNDMIAVSIHCQEYQL